VRGNPSRYYDTDGRQVAEGIATAAAADPPGAALAAAAVAMDRSLPPELRTSIYALLLFSIQTRLGQNIFNGLIQRSKGKSQTRKRDVRRRPGVKARPERGKQDRDKVDRAADRTDPKPKQKPGDHGGLEDGQPGENDPQPNPKRTPRDNRSRIIKGIIDLIPNIFGPPHS
jgi:hypothetical protein